MHIPRPYPRLGKKPAKIDHRTLRLSRYLTDKLPAPPPTADHGSRVTSWPMYGNDQYGDCGPAGIGHQIESWSTYAGHALLPSTGQITDAYFAITGGKDTGVYLLDMLNYYHQAGIAGDHCEAFVQVGINKTEAQITVNEFGSLGIGLSLPDVNTFGPWIDVQGPPNPYNGHYVCAVGYDADGLDVVTWGANVRMSWAFFLKYCDEAYAILNDLSLIQATMRTPEGFDFAALQSDLSQIGDPVIPPYEPPPPPNPSPGCLGSLLVPLLLLLFWVMI